MRRHEKLEFDEDDESKHGHLWPRIVGAVLLGSAAIGITIKVAKHRADKKHSKKAADAHKPNQEEDLTEETYNFVPTKCAFTWKRDNPDHLIPHSAAGTLVGQDGTVKPVRMQIKQDPDKPSTEFIIEPEE